MPTAKGDRGLHATRVLVKGYAIMGGSFVNSIISLLW